MKLTHPFVNKCPNIDELFLTEDGKNVICTINQLCYRISKLAEQYKDRYDENLFKGDALEMFVEYMIRTAPEDNRIGIYDYQPISDSETSDVGVDGFGKGTNSYPATVQVKFRAGNYVLTANDDHLSNFLTASWNDFNVPIDNTKNMLIVTTGQKVDERTIEKMLKNKVRVLARTHLEQMYDNCPEWWKRFYESVKDSRINPPHGTPKHNPVPLRQHQSNAIKQINADSNSRGKIIMPTGCGKTMVEADAIFNTIQKAKNEGNLSPVIKVNASRILLCFQLFDEILKRLMDFGVDARYVNFNSGNKDDTDYAEMMANEGWEYRSIHSTTSINEVKDIFRQCQIDKLPLIIFSTYHSSDRFKDSGIIPALTVNDEAHNLVSDAFGQAAILPTIGNLFFTATEKITMGEDGLGMNNEKIFDNLIYAVSAKEMIDAGEMVPPFIHVVTSSNNKSVDTDYDVMFASIMEAFNVHDNTIRSRSYDASQLGAKVLVVCRGQQDLIAMLTDERIERFKTIYPDVHLFALSSEFGLVNDGIKSYPPVTNVKKYQMLKCLKAMAHNEKALIFHVDMIGEGIDVPGITGVMPFRNCEESKLIQNVGRSSRLHPIDRKRFYDGEISVNDKSIDAAHNENNKWIKPCSWVIIPSYMADSSDMASNFHFIIDRLRSEFGYIPQQQTLIDNVEGTPEQDKPPVVNDPKNKFRGSKSGVVGLVHTLEERIETEMIQEQKNLIILTMLKGLKCIKENKPVPPVQKIEVVVNTEDTTVKETMIPTRPEGLWLYCIRKSANVDATAVCGNGKTLEVLKGSHFRKTEVPSCPDTTQKIRKDMLKKGILVVRQDHLLLTQNHTFKSVSAASCAVLGQSSNGNMDWKNNEDVPLGKIIS